MLDVPLTLLTKEELIELTGKKRPNAMCRALDAMNIRYVRGPAGQCPRVSRAHVREVLVSGVRRPWDAPARAAPNFDAFCRRA